MPMRRITLLLLCLLLLCGCRRMVEGEYQVVTDHVETSLNPETSDLIYEVHTYSGLRRAVQEMVDTKMQEGVIHAVEYSGAIREDISKVCLDVTRSSPLGSYAVEYMTHSVARILTYDEILIHINYKLSPEEIDAVQPVSSPSDFFRLIDEGLDAGTEFLAIQIATLSINDKNLDAHIENYYRSHPDRLLSRPDVSIGFYPSEDYVQKIITLSLNYHTPPELRDTLLEELRQRALELIRDMEPGGTASMARLCCATVSDCIRGDEPRGSTAYDVLVDGSGDSEGCAMAYRLLCGYVGIPCQVVSGRLNSEPHYWNLICLDEAYYHVDCSACMDGSLENGFLKRDSDLWGRYWWEADMYPAADSDPGAILEQFREPENVPEIIPYSEA